MSEMVERVAEAIWVASGFARMHPEGFRGRPVQVRERYMHDALAAIKAMREPTKEMCEEGLDTGQFENGVFRVDVDAPREVYRAMIDAALPTPSEKDKDDGR